LKNTAFSNKPQHCFFKKFPLWHRLLSAIDAGNSLYCTTV